MSVSRVVGVDLADRNDFTAVTVLDVDRRAVTRDQPFPTLHVGYTQRLRGMGYEAIANELVGMSLWPALSRARWAVDATGVGGVVFDLLRPRIPSLTGVVITSGLDVTEPHPNQIGVPKERLIGNLQVYLEARRLTVDPSVKDAKALRDELLNFTYSISDSGRMTSGAAGTGHDDFVLSLAIGAWVAGHRAPNDAYAWGEMYQRVYGTPRAMPAPAPAEPEPVGTTDEDRRAAARTAAFRNQFPRGS